VGTHERSAKQTFVATLLPWRTSITILHRQVDSKSFAPERLQVLLFQRFCQGTYLHIDCLDKGSGCRHRGRQSSGMSRADTANGPRMEAAPRHTCYVAGTRLGDHCSQGRTFLPTTWACLCMAKISHGRMHTLRCRRQRHVAVHPKRCDAAVKATCPQATTSEDTAGTLFR